MTSTGIHYPHGIVTPGGSITQLVDVTPAYNFSDLTEFAAGQTAPQLGGSQAAIPDMTFETQQLATLLGLIDTEGVSKSYSAANVDIEYKAGQALGTRVADATLGHIRGRLVNSLLYWTGVKASQGGIATVTARILPVWDGTNNPLVFTGSLALTATSAATHVYTLGRIDLNGTNIATVQDLDWQNNIETEEIADSGEGYITYAGIKTFSPVFTFRSRDATLLTTYGATGTALTGFEVYLRKYSPNGLLVAENVAEHVKLHNASAAGVIKARQVSGLDGVVEVQVTLLKPSATTDPFTIVTASAIT